MASVQCAGCSLVQTLHDCSASVTPPQEKRKTVRFSPENGHVLPGLKPTTSFGFISKSISASPMPALIACASPSGNTVESTGDEGEDAALESLRRVLVSDNESELAERIMSGEFTVGSTNKLRKLKQFFLKFGQDGRSLALSVARFERKQRLKRAKRLPEAKGDINAITGQPFFIPLYNLYLTYGGVFRLTFGPKSFVIVSDPAMAKRILKDNSKSYSKGILAEILHFVMGKGLIPADEEIWRVRRRAIVPAVHRKYVAAMVGLFGRATEKLCKKLDVAVTDGEDVEMESLFSRLTLDVIGKAVFNYDFDSLSHDTGIIEAVYVALREAEDRSVAIFPYWNIPVIKDIFPRQRKVASALKLINETLDELISTCKRMVEEENESFSEEYMNELDPSILRFLLASSDDVASKQLRDDLMTLLIAGHETSAAVLTWAFYLLAKNPIIMDKLQREVDLVIGDRLPTIEDMKRLRLTTRVINETLRLYPQPPVLIRRALQDDVLGQYYIKKGEDIFISLWNLHRSPHLWENAEEFKPERWPLDGLDPTEVSENYRYLPFGGGPRKCLGDMFATFETITAVAMLVRRFNFELSVESSVGMTTGATIHTTAGLKMTVTNRTKPPVIPVTEVSTLAPVNTNGSIKSHNPNANGVAAFTSAKANWELEKKAGKSNF